MKTNWQIKTLGEVADILMGQSPPSNTYNTLGAGLPFFQGKADFNDVYPSISKYCSKPVRVAQKDDVLLSVRAPVGPVNLAPSEICIGRGLSAIRGRRNVLNQMYLFYFMKLNELALGKKGTGSTFSSINRRDIEKISLPLPSLSAQQQVVEKLDAIRKLQELNEIKIERAEELFSYSVKRIFFPKAGKKCKINEIADGFQYGLSRAMNSNGSGMPILRINSIEDGSIVDKDLKCVEVSNEELNRYKVQLNDILFNRTNSYELVGKTGIFKLPGTFVFASYLIRVRAKDEVLPDYLNYFLNSPIGQAEIRRKAKRAVSQANVNAKELGSIGIYIPDKSIQEEAVSQLNSIKQYLQVLKTEKEKLVELFECLLSKELQT